MVKLYILQFLDLQPIGFARIAPNSSKKKQFTHRKKTVNSKFKNAQQQFGY
jgi:hypothetical protein